MDKILGLPSLAWIPLLPLLGHFLREQELAKADRERLAAFRRDKACA